MSSLRYVDLQINGYFGVDFSDPELTEDAFMLAAEHIFASGTDIFLPTLVTSPKEVYFHNLSTIRNACEKHGILQNVPGVHLEGPFISKADGAIGAHPVAFAREADIDFFDELMAHSGNFVRLLTMAAELPQAAAMIKHVSECGVVVSCGHQLATSRDLAQAAAAGARLLTHLGNGCPNLMDRHQNVIWAGMACDALSAMIITDGHHLPPELIKCFFRVKGPGRLIITSDAAPVAGLAPGRYRIWGNDAVLEPNGFFHNPEKKCLVGSSASLKQCADYLRSLGIATEEEIQKMTCENPLAIVQGGTDRIESL